ncbi:hypothetical protein U1Q18_030580 [Sarracenia purpurea var. burkii]
MRKTRVLAVTFDERIPEIDVGLQNAVKDAGGVGYVRREGGAERDEAGYDKVVLFCAFVDYLHVDLFEVWHGFARREQRWD